MAGVKCVSYLPVIDRSRINPRQRFERKRREEGRLFSVHRLAVPENGGEWIMVETSSCARAPIRTVTVQ